MLPQSARISRITLLTPGARTLAWLLLFIMALCIPAPAHAISFELDSIAAWGKFPRFCVNTYRWGDKFFNSYDEEYVVGSGKRFNIKFKADSWLDSYDFRFKDNYRMEMISDPSTTVGFYLTYMAVSVGYDMNLSKYFNGGERARKKFNFAFNCSLFTVEFATVSNDIGTSIKRMGEPGAVEKVNIPFKGINTNLWTLDMYYFFNHKRYSQSAAFSYGKIQRRSNGTFFAGLSLWAQRYQFDFEDLASDLGRKLPEDWNLRYYVRNRNYALRIGYAYNWVFHPGWCVGAWVAPTVGLRKGFINYPDEMKSSFALSTAARLSLVYNYKTKWFYGIVGRFDGNIIYDKSHSLISSNMSVEVSAGFRFDFRKQTPGKEQEPLVF